MVPSLVGAVLPQPGDGCEGEDEVARRGDEAAIEVPAMLADKPRAANSGDAHIQPALQRFIVSGCGRWAKQGRMCERGSMPAQAKCDPQISRAQSKIGQDAQLKLHAWW